MQPSPVSIYLEHGVDRAVSEVDEDTARKIFKLIDALEDSDDVQNVYANADISDEILAALDA